MPTEAMSKEELQAFDDLAKSFAEKDVRPMLDVETADGELSMTSGILDRAESVGLFTSLDPDAAGYELGVFGAGVKNVGCWPSLLLLRRLAYVCGGTAMCFHAQGMGATPLFAGAVNAPKPLARLALGLQEPFGLSWYDGLLDPSADSPEPVRTTLAKAGRGNKLQGAKAFVWQPPKTKLYSILGRGEDSGWKCFAVPADSQGLSITPVGKRIGLRACEVMHLEFNDVSVPAKNVIDLGSAELFRLLGYFWLGLGSIGIGIAEGALSSAIEYTAERYQGGKIINQHAAVKMLLSESATRIQASIGMLERAAASDEADSKEFLKLAAMAKLSIMEATAQAVTDCLQTFGGYGYMEDYRMEKRLRDVSALKCMGGSPNYLKILIADAGMEA